MFNMDSTDTLLGALMIKFNYYLTHVQKYSINTSYCYVTTLNMYRLFVCNNETMDSRLCTISEIINTSNIKRYILHLHMKGIKKRSIAYHVSVLRSFVSFLQSIDISLDIVPQDIILPRYSKGLPQILSVKEIAVLLNQPNVNMYIGLRDRAILELLYGSGLRVSELVGLDILDIDFKENMVRVVGKGNKVRYVPITMDASHFISCYIQHLDRRQESRENIHAVTNDRMAAVFLNRYGTRLTTRSVTRLVNKYAKHSGVLPIVYPHMLRHSIATHLLSAGMNIKYIQEILGHTSIITTSLYARINDKLKESEYYCFHPDSSFCIE